MSCGPSAANGLGCLQVCFLFCTGKELSYLIPFPLKEIFWHMMNSSLKRQKVLPRYLANQSRVLFQEGTELISTPFNRSWLFAFLYFLKSSDSSPAPTTKPQVILIHSKIIVCLVLLGGRGGPPLLNRQYYSHCESATSHKRTLNKMKYNILLCLDFKYLLYRELK